MNDCDQIATRYELDRCIQWILTNNFSKVCLQFPDQHLPESVEVANILDLKTPEKTFILGDTTYGSCCVDFIAAQHVNAEALIHFGPSCLSPLDRTSIPVLHILPKRNLNVTEFINRLSSLPPPRLVFYDETFHHLADELRTEVGPETIVSQIMTMNEAKIKCGPWCHSETAHAQVVLSRGFCPPEHDIQSTVYLGSSSRLKTNLLLATKGTDFYEYSNDSFNLQDRLPILKKLMFLVEKVKAADRIGLVVGTLAVDGYRQAVTHVKNLCRSRKKRVYSISIGKPTVAKLSNFPEIDVFVVIACPETEFIDRKSTIQPIVSLLEIELALNQNRTWEDGFSNEFSYFLPGGTGYIEHSVDTNEEENDFSLVSNQVALRPDMQITSQSMFSNSSWDGLEISGQTEVLKATPGRSGHAQSYTTEPNVD